MNVGSCFSGIGGMDHGLSRAGFQHAFFCESDEWRREVLTTRWPGVPVYTDVRTLGVEPETGTPDDGCVAEPDGTGWLHTAAVLDLLCGGFPCQDVSVAGRRAGLAGDRSGLFFEFARVIDVVRPGWVLVENVPGLLSSNGGRDFGVVLGTLADLGYGVAWRILDSRYFNVPQRRRRVFIIGARAHDDPRAAAGRAGEVLAVGTRCAGHPPTGGEEGPDVARSFAGRSPSRLDDAAVGGGQLVAATLKSHNGKGGSGISPEDTFIAAPLKSANGRSGGMSYDPSSDNYVAGPLGGGNDGIGRRSEDDPNLVTQASVRRLTPRECERLQALPDDWTLLSEKTPDSRRYSSLGDAVTSSVAEWIGRRIAASGAVSRSDTT